jgi:hypothetical protein
VHAAIRASTEVRPSPIRGTQPAVSSLRRRSEDLTCDLEAIGRTLADLAARDLPREQTDAIGPALKAIRLQLQRMSVHQQAFSDELARRITESP